MKSQSTRRTWETRRLPYSILTKQCDTIGLGLWLTTDFQFWPLRTKVWALLYSDIQPVTMVVEEENDGEAAISLQSDHLSRRRPLRYALLNGLLAVLPGNTSLHCAVL